VSRITKTLAVLLSIIAICITLRFFYKLGSNTFPTSGIEECIEKIDSIQSEIDKLSDIKDSINQRIDTVTITIEKTHIQYEKDRTTIISNTTDEDYVFFIDYIRKNRSRLDSINHF
jgi:hypothetical protein